jgi:hypothetical protein
MLFVLADDKLTSKQIQSLMAKTVDLDCFFFYIYIYIYIYLCRCPASLRAPRLISRPTEHPANPVNM